VSVRSEQAARTEAELQAAAVRVFAQRGYLNTKITDITAEAGRATGSFYKHFTSKEKLLESLLARLLEQSDEAVAAAGNHPEDFRDRDAVRWHVETFVRAFREHRTVMVALQQAATVDETFARRQSDLFRPDLEHLADHLDRLDLSVEPLVAARLMTGLMWSFAATSGNSDAAPDVSPAAMVETLTAFIHGGLHGLAKHRA
jgi:AcrR family transcriptional regulator